MPSSTTNALKRHADKMTTDFPTAPGAYSLNGPSAPATVEKSNHASHTEILTTPWRRMSKTGLAHAVYQLPEAMADRCIALTRKLGLRFGAIDFVLDQEGQLWFLEINPNGQWGWIETRTGHPIAAAIVSELERIANA